MSVTVRKPAVYINCVHLFVHVNNSGTMIKLKIYKIVLIDKLSLKFNFTQLPFLRFVYSYTQTKRRRWDDLGTHLANPKPAYLYVGHALKLNPLARRGTGQLGTNWRWPTESEGEVWSTLNMLKARDELKEVKDEREWRGFDDLCSVQSPKYYKYLKVICGFNTLLKKRT